MNTPPAAGALAPRGTRPALCGNWGRALDTKDARATSWDRRLLYGARDEIRTHRKHCFRSVSEPAAPPSTFSLIARRSPSRWQRDARVDFIEEARLKRPCRRVSVNSGGKRVTRTQTNHRLEIAGIEMSQHAGLTCCSRRHELVARRPSPAFRTAGARRSDNETPRGRLGPSHRPFIHRSFSRRRQAAL